MIADEWSGPTERILKDVKLFEGVGKNEADCLEIVKTLSTIPPNNGFPHIAVVISSSIDAMILQMRSGL
jgi:hypothetical protein